MGRGKIQKTTGNLSGNQSLLCKCKREPIFHCKTTICQIITNLYSEYDFLRDSEALTQKDRDFFDQVSADMSDNDATIALHQSAYEIWFCV